jgi:predicted transposase
MAGKKAEKGDVLYLGVHARLVFPDPRDEEAVLDLMRRFSSATRYAYRRLLAGKPREELKRADGPLRKLFRLNTRYADGAIAKAKAVLDSALELGNDPKKVIFGGRGLFEQLKRKHLSGKDRERLKRRWKEKRRGLLYTRGDRSKKGGNPHFKLQVEGGGLWLLVHLGEEEGKEEGERKKFARALVKTSHPQLNALLERIHTGLPYNAELTLKEGKVYAQFTWSEALPPPVHTRANGVLGIDVNSDPYHLALAVVSPDGNLKRHLTLSLEEVDSGSQQGGQGARSSGKSPTGWWPWPRNTGSPSPRRGSSASVSPGEETAQAGRFAINSTASPTGPSWRRSTPSPESGAWRSWR